MLKHIQGVFNRSRIIGTVDSTTKKNKFYVEMTLVKSLGKFSTKACSKIFRKFLPLIGD